MRVLIVDDFAVSRIMIERVIKSVRGCEMDFAANGVEALRYYREHCHDLILLDQNMPKMSGTEFLRELANHPSIATTHVIMITGSADANLVSTIKNEGLKVDDLLVKPFDTATLLRKVAAVRARVIRRCAENPSGFTHSSADWAAVAVSEAPGEPSASFSGVIIDRGGVALVRLKGAFTQANWSEINSLVKQVQECFAPEVILDFGGVTDVDETGLGLAAVINGMLALDQRQCFIYFGRFTQKERFDKLGLTQIIPVRERLRDQFEEDEDLRRFSEAPD